MLFGMSKNVGVIACILSVSGYFLPFLSDRCSSRGERTYESFFELAQAGPFVFIFIVASLLSCVLLIIGWKKISAFIAVTLLLLMLGFFSIFTYACVLSSKSGDFWMFIKYQEFSFIGYGWYVIILGYCLHLVSVFIKSPQ